MTDLKTGAAEQALSEHLTAVGKPPYEGTGYHDSIASLRRELAGDAGWFRKMGEPHKKIVNTWLLRPHGAVPAGTPESGKPAQVVIDADVACLMASTYAYTLAAVLGAVHKKFGTEAAREIAWVADDILMNGDDSDRNADVMPAAEDAEAPQ